ncbi:MAG: tetratricopeptide repeat protein [Chitinispirillaceae bacterium]
MKMCKTFGLLLVVGAFCFSLMAQSTEELMSRGNVMLQRGAYSQAVTAFRKIARRQPSNFEAQYNLAFAYLGWGRNAKAVQEFKKALGLQPNSSHAWANLAVAYENMGDISKALGALDKAVRADPNNITARVNLAATYANNNQLKKAISEYMSVIEIDGSNAEVYLALSRCLLSADRTEEAKNYLTEATVADPQNEEAHWELAQIYWKEEKDLDKALTELRLAVDINPEVIRFYNDMARIQVEQEKKAEAVKTLKKALVYSDDVLIKEEIQANIDMLEGRDTDGGAKSSSAPKFQMKALKRESQRDTTKPKRMKTSPVNVDFGDLMGEDSEDENSDLFDFPGQKK